MDFTCTGSFCTVCTAGIDLYKQLIELEAAGWTLPAQVVVVQLYTLLQLIELQAAGWTLPAQVSFVQYYS